VFRRPAVLAPVIPGEAESSLPVARL
jgi:hypothetical protein